jgi:5-methylcytosine-specific restriction endonuclease McrA
MSPFWPLHALAALAREAVKRHTRSPHWRAVELEFRRQHPTCAACGTKHLLAVHHVFPFSQYPQLELETANLIALCMGPRECHLVVGHKGNWRAWNPSVRLDAQRQLDGIRRGRRP